MRYFGVYAVDRLYYNSERYLCYVRYVKESYDLYTIVPNIRLPNYDHAGE